ncbi:hypothetical protein NM688_g685 [Phlebia brevispora]|uniref:Uncharacterized protein n=1 Tax=Phlebia brevispora TaxID=194682 RepID=A0ACC1TDR4_9APHY|nr:hypothetical protein NM688_g685 [Phlebia brevispora]
MTALTSFIAPTAGIVLPLALMLSGILTVQLHFYLTQYEQDPFFRKAFVILVCLVDYAQSALCIHLFHAYLSADFMDVLEILHIDWSVGAFITLEVLLIVMIQTFYVYRAWLLSNKNWAVGLIPGITLSLRTGFGFATAALTSNGSFIPCLRAQIGDTIRLTLSGSLCPAHSGLCDQHRRKYFDNVNSDLNHVYANTMLANLNARKHIRHAMTLHPRVFDSGVALSGPPSGMRTTDTWTDARGNIQHPRINIETGGIQDSALVEEPENVISRLAHLPGHDVPWLSYVPSLDQFEPPYNFYEPPIVSDKVFKR